MEKTGKHILCGCADLAGNCWTWTNETKVTERGQFAVICGGCYALNGFAEPMASRRNYNPFNEYYGIGFRIVI